MSILAALLGGGSALLGGAISGIGQQRAAEAQLQARLDAINAANSAREGLFGSAIGGSFLGGYGTEDIFGTRVDPEAALYNPVDITESQAQTIAGNLQNFPAIGILTDLTNEFIDEQAMNRLNRLFPGATENIGQIGENTSALLRGELPADVVSEIINDTQSIGGQLGTPGTSSSQTLKHLGLNRLQAIQQGQSMFSSFVDLANRSISPVGNQLRPQDHFLNPSERMQADIHQAELEQQGRLSSAILAAAPDPAAAGLFNAELTAQMMNAGMTAGAGAGINTGIGAATLGAGISNAGSLAASFLMQPRGGGFQPAVQPSTVNNYYS